MSETFTVTLSDETARRAKDAADHSGRPVEVILSEWVEHSATANDISPLMPDVEYPLYTPLGNEAAAAILMKLI